MQRHVLRLLLHLHHRVAPSKLEALQKALEPTGQVRPPAACTLRLRCLCWPEPGVRVSPCRGPAHGGGGVCAHPHTHTCLEASPQSGEAVKELYSQLGELESSWTTEA